MRMFNNQNGFSLVSAMVSAGIAATIAAGLMTLMNNTKKEQTNINTQQSLQSVSRNLESLIRDTQAWTKTVESGDLQMKECLLDATKAGVCPVEASKQPFILYNKDGSVVYDGTAADRGFTEDGLACTSFNPTTGNIRCPFRLELFYYVETPDVLVFPRAAKVEGNWLYSPGADSKKKISFNFQKYRIRVEMAGSGFNGRADFLKSVCDMFRGTFDPNVETCNDFNMDMRFLGRLRVEGRTTLNDQLNVNGTAMINGNLVASTASIATNMWLGGGVNATTYLTAGGDITGTNVTATNALGAGVVINSNGTLNVAGNINSGGNIAASGTVSASGPAVTVPSLPTPTPTPLPTPGPTPGPPTPAPPSDIEEFSNHVKLPGGTIVAWGTGSASQGVTPVSLGAPFTMPPWSIVASGGSNSSTNAQDNSISVYGHPVSTSNSTFYVHHAIDTPTTFSWIAIGK